MKIIDILKNSNLKYKNVLEKLVGFYLWIPKEEIFKNFDMEVSDITYEKIIKWYSEYVNQKKPLEYILWYVEFFGLKFKVNEYTLIPRPETEYMITAVCNHINENIQNNKVNIIDVWTWCWVIWISAFYWNSSYTDNLLLLDVDKNALSVAKENLLYFCKDHNKVSLAESNLLDYFIKNKQNFENNLNLIVWNLPYIPDEVFENDVEDNVRLWEPGKAFVWWEDGLDLYRELLNQLTDYEIKNINTVIFLEMMENQVVKLQEEYKNIFEFEIIKTFHFNIKIVKLEKV